MKIRLGLVAAASAAAIGATILTGALPAHAAQIDEFHIVNSGGTFYYILGPISPNLPLRVITGGGTQFENVNGTTKSIDGSNPEPVFEWQELNTNLCWTYEPSNLEVNLQSCTPNDTEQLFWQTTSGHFINVSASNSAGTGFCLNATHAVDGDPINIIGCKSQSAPGGFDQFWFS